MADEQTEIEQPTPWPHGWRHGMQLLPVPEMGLPPAMVYQASLTMLRCVDIGGGYEHGAMVRADPTDPRVQPDLDDGPTKGALLEMAREATGNAHYFLMPVEDYQVYLGPKRWLDPVTGQSYATEGEAYKAALDKLAADSKGGPHGR